MQGDQGERDDNDFGIELQWPAGSGDEPAAPGPPPPAGARAVAPAFEPIDPGDGESDRPTVDVRESATSSLGRDHQALPLLPAMAGRIESVHGAIATLGVRIDALAAASNSFRSVLSDRLSDHVDAMSRLANTQSQELEDYRQANDRIVAELRQVATENEATLRRLSERFDETAAELVAMTGAISALAPARGTAAAEGDTVATQVTENMEHVGSQILDQVDDLVATNSGVVAEMQALLGRLETAAPTAAGVPATTEHSAELLDALASIEDRLEAADQQQTAQLKELHGLLGRLQASAGTAGAGAGDDVLDALAAIEERLEAADQQQSVQLNELADGIAAIEERIADGAIAIGSATGDQIASGELIEALRSAAAEVQAVGDELRDVRVTVQDLKKTAPAVAGVPAAGVPSGAFDDLREELQAELTALRDELTQLRRRISVRAKAPAVLEDEQIDAIVEAVAARIEIPSVPSEVNLGKDALDELAARVTERLAESFEVVAEEPPAPAPPPRAPLRAPRKAAPPTPPPASRPRRTR